MAIADDPTGVLNRYETIKTNISGITDVGAALLLLAELYHTYIKIISGQIDAKQATVVQN